MGNPKLAKILRCTGLALLVLGVLAFVPASAQAALHGAQILKGCQPSTNCNEDADCDNGLFCDGAETCSTISDTQPHVDCTIEVTNTDGFDDSLTLRTACDRIKPGAGDEFVDCTIEITGVTDNAPTGDTTCVTGMVLGADTLTDNCVIGHDDVVTFASVSYQIQASDPAPLPDQATVQETDNCDGTPSADCNSGQLNNLQASSQTTLTDNCQPGTPPCPEDNDLCTTITCNEDTNGCDTANKSCPDDADLCNGTPFCDPTTGECAPGTPVDCPDDNDLCNGTPFCVPGTGQCDPGTAVVCDDPCFTCDPTAGTCTTPSGLPECNNEEICRTPGFWGTHGGTEKVGHSTNITQEVLDTFGGTLTICGTVIDNTGVGNTHSALEAICVSPKGDSRLQLARQLTAAALNCGITNSTGTPGECSAQNGAAPCAGVSVEDVWNACNAACLTGTTAEVDGHTISCIGAIDCFNNGGVFNVETNGCNDALGESCHDRNLVTDCFSFDPPGAAGSPGACNQARKNDVVVVPPLP